MHVSTIVAHHGTGNVIPPCWPDAYAGQSHQVQDASESHQIQNNVIPMVTPIKRTGQGTEHASDCRAKHDTFHKFGCFRA